jgi:hypothetical protein
VDNPGSFQTSRVASQLWLLRPSLAYQDATPYQQAARSRMGKQEGSHFVLSYQPFLARCGRKDGEGAQLCRHVSLISERRFTSALAN